MFTNVREQKGEIAILRSLGITKLQIARMYIHEAFTLLVASASIGSIIGIFVGKIISYILTTYISCSRLYFIISLNKKFSPQRKRERKIVER